MVWVEGGGIRGQSCGNAEKGLPEGGAHGLVDVASLSAADADEGIGDLRSVWQKAMSRSSASSEEAPENSTVQAVMPAAWKQLQNFRAVFRVKERVNNRQRSWAIIGCKGRQIPEFTRPLYVAEGD